jgi:hypothetical protein
MSARWIGLIVFVALLMAGVGAMAQGATLELGTAANSTADPNINNVMSYTLTWQNFDWGRLALPSTHVTFFSSLFKLLVGQQNLYAVFPKASPFLWIWLIMWLPIVATVVFGILMIFFSILQRVLG